MWSYIWGVSTFAVSVMVQTYIADVDSIDLGELEGGGVRWQVNGELVFIPDLPIFPLSKEH